MFMKTGHLHLSYVFPLIIVVKGAGFAIQGSQDQNGPR